MSSATLIEMIDNEIQRLESARKALAGVGNGLSVKVKTAGKKKRNLSPEGRKRIAEAVRRRWAAQRKAAAAGK
jgi:hypothetical protein